MGLTVAEKEHWKERLAHRIERKIQALVTQTDSTFLTKLDDKCHQLVKERYGVVSDLAKADQLEESSRRDAELSREMYAAILRKLNGLTKSSYINPYNCQSEIKVAIRNLAVNERAELLRESELGRKILKLEQEKEELLDTIWLATSPKQIKDLWEAVGELVDEDSTDLQAKALKAEPVE